jgi:RNA polymerase sigma-70 factor, ECF subfamily
VKRVAPPSVPPDSDFERLRPRLFGIAYGMLGDPDGAQDVVQETYLRWHESTQDAVRSPEAWLVTTTSRLALDRLRRVTTERAAYAGPWLPGPVATDERLAPDREAELASELSVAFLLLLERLAPDERAAFLLREVFGADYREIARILERSELATRQVVHRARKRVQTDRPRFTPSPDAEQRLLGRFLAALTAGDKDALLALFAEEATFTADGGGKVASARNVLVGGERISRALLGYEAKGRGLLQHHSAVLNGQPALLSTVAGQVYIATLLETDGEHIHAVYRVLNPDKLRHVHVGEPRQVASVAAAPGAPEREAEGRST